MNEVEFAVWVMSHAQAGIREGDHERVLLELRDAATAHLCAQLVPA